METKSLTETALYLFGLSHYEDGWIHPLPDVAEAVEADEAAWSPGAGVKSIWEVTEHAANYLEDLANELEGKPSAEHEDWPVITDKNPNAWQKQRERLRKAAEKVVKEVSKLDDEALRRPAEGSEDTRLKRVCDIAIHDAYHVGQIVKLRQMYAATKARAVVAGASAV